MATEVLAPDAVLDLTNYTTLNIADIDEDPGSPDANWGAWDTNGNTSGRVSFPTPSGNPTTGAGLQTFRVLIRKTASGGPSTTWSLQLWENGVQVAELATGTTTSLTGEVVSGTWNASSLGTADGSLVECRLQQTAGGTGGTRRGVEVGAAAWDVTYDASSSSDGSAAGTSTATATGAATAQAPGSASGSGDATATGQATAASPGSAAGTSDTTATGQATASSAASSTGAATATASGEALASAAGSAPCSATATATGTATATAAGSAAGSSTALAQSGDGGEPMEGDGLSEGAAVAAATAAAVAVAVGSAVGASMATAAGQALITAAGSAAGVSAASGAGLAEARAAAAAAGLAEALSDEALATAVGEGFSPGLSFVNGFSQGAPPGYSSAYWDIFGPLITGHKRERLVWTRRGNV